MGGLGVAGVASGRKDAQRDSPIEGAGIEIWQAVVPGQAFSHRPLAGCGGPVHGNDEGAAWPAHASVIAAPRLSISATKPGKLVAIMSGSSTVTGAVLARPSTRWAMAIR